MNLDKRGRDALMRNDRRGTWAWSDQSHQSHLLGGTSRETESYSSGSRGHPGNGDTEQVKTAAAAEHLEIPFLINRVRWGRRVEELLQWLRCSGPINSRHRLCNTALVRRKSWRWQHRPQRSFIYGVSISERALLVISEMGTFHNIDLLDEVLN